MKKFSTYLASALLTLVVFTSCSSSPEDINVADLDGPCEFVDAMGDCADALLGIVEGVDSPDQLSESDRNRGQALSEKLNELMKTARDKFDEEPDCPNMDEVEEKLEKADRYL